MEFLKKKKKGIVNTHLFVLLSVYFNRNNHEELTQIIHVI